MISEKMKYFVSKYSNLICWKRLAEPQTAHHLELGIKINQIYNPMALVTNVTLFHN